LWFTDVPFPPKISFFSGLRFLFINA
jgi:hypothetical protein